MVDKQRSRRVDDVLTVIEAVYIPFDDLNIKLIHPGLRGGGQLPSAIPIYFRTLIASPSSYLPPIPLGYRPPLMTLLMAKLCWKGRHIAHETPDAST